MPLDFSSLRPSGTEGTGGALFRQNVAIMIDIRQLSHRVTLRLYLKHVDHAELLVFRKRYLGDYQYCSTQRVVDGECLELMAVDSMFKVIATGTNGQVVEREVYFDAEMITASTAVIPVCGTEGVVAMAPIERLMPISVRS